MYIYVHTQGLLIMLFLSGMVYYVASPGERSQVGVLTGGQYRPYMSYSLTSLKRII